MRVYTELTTAMCHNDESTPHTFLPHRPLNRGADLESPEGDPAVLKKGTPVDVKGEVTLPDGKVRLHVIHYESKGYGNKKIFT